MKHLTILFAVSFLLFACEQKEVVRIYPNEVITENFIGNGVQWDPYPHADAPDAEWGMLMTDAKWQKVFDRLDYMKPRLVRTLDQANWRYLMGFDKNGNAILNFDTPEEKALEKLLDYCQKNNITVLLGEWGTPYAVHDTTAGFSGILKGADDQRWINMIAEHLNYLIKEKGFTCIKYFNLVNEPNGDWSSTNGNYEEWSYGAKMLSQTLVEQGLDQYVSVAGPDAVAHYNHPDYNLTGMQWVTNTADDLGNEIGALEIHAYFNQSVIRDAQFESLYHPLVDAAHAISKPIFFGELGFEKSTPENEARIKADPYTSIDSYMGVYDYQHGIDMADAAIQIMQTGFYGAAAWDLDDAMHTKDDSGNPNQLKRWGMWNSLGTELCDNPNDENLRPWFYSWSLLCRYIEPGSQVVKTDKLTNGVRITATQKNGELTIALVNQSETDQKIHLGIPSEFNQKIFQLFSYEENNYLTDEYGFPKAENARLKTKNSRIEVHLPSKSFKLITSYTY